MSPLPRPPVVVTLSRDEMRTRALAFAKTSAGPQREKSEAQAFLNEFVEIFGRDRRVVDTREPHLALGASLADLDEPPAMPAEVLKAPQALDRDVEKAYRSAVFTNDRERVEFLIARYEPLVAPLAPVAQSARRTRREITEVGYTQAEVDASHPYFLAEEPAPYEPAGDREKK